MAGNLTSDAPPRHATIGNWVARCGPKGKASTFGLVILFGFMAAGLFVLCLAFFIKPEPGSEVMPTIFKILGVAMIVIGIGVMVLMAMMKNPQVDLYTGGFRFKTKAEEIFVSWQQIEKGLLTTIYDTRFSSYRAMRIHIAGRKEPVSFESKLEGESDKVIDGIAKNARNLEVNQIDMGA